MLNGFGDLVLIIIWPGISLLFFKKLPTIPAIFLTIVGGYLLLPVGNKLDLPLIPPLNKEMLTSLVALFGYIIIKKEKFHFIPKTGLEKWLILSILILPILITVTNAEPVFNGKIWITGLSFKDSYSDMINMYLIILPFLIGSQIIKSSEDQLQLFKLMVISGLFYCVLSLYEIRMSPQLHTIIYGYFPHSFLQQMRYGGFRPVVFIGHGLFVAMFLTIVLGSAAILYKRKVSVFGIPPIITIAIVLIVLVLSKAVGPFLLGIILLVCILFLSNSLMNTTAKVLMSIVMLYPLLSMFDLFPRDEIIEFFNSIVPGRSLSLAFRFYHEYNLVEHTQEKFIFGWGGWGRNMLWRSVVDGYWIITFSKRGIVGFIVIFSLAAISIWRAVKSSSLLVNPADKKMLSAHIILVAIIMVDQIPNASLSSYMWLILGALLGRANTIINQSKIRTANI